MPNALRSALAALVFVLPSSTALAQQVWIQSFENMAPGEKPNGYRFDYNSLLINGAIRVDMAWTQDFFNTGGLEVWINGQLAPFFSCSIPGPGGTSGDCTVYLPYSCGKMRVFVVRAIAFPPGGFLTSSPVDIFSYDNQRCVPQCDSCQLTTIGQGPGKPVNAATGKLWYRTTDMALSGPFGLNFARWYDNQSPYNADLGFGWRHSYGAFLDLSQQAPNKMIAFRDEEDRVTYFTQLNAGASVHDDTSGSDLALNSAGTVYTLTTWSGAKYTFDSAGRLTALVDRIGNTQTITRDASQRIDFVTDALGRQLDFAYDASNRVVSVTANPPGPSLSFTYSGANCPTGNLCSATMPDNQTWTYEYTASGNNLTKVTDPNGNAEEINTYSGEKIATQKTQGDQNMLTFAYPSATSTTVTDRPEPPDHVHL